MQLHEIKSAKGSRKRKRIVGRGPGSGAGQTAGRGENGQRSRAGRWKVGGLEGGQMPLIRRLPKMGFRSHRPILNQIVSLSSLDKFENGAEVTGETLKAKGLIASINKPFKILGNGDISKKVKVKARSVSKSAQEKIVKAGGTVEILSRPVVIRNKKKK